MATIRDRYILDVDTKGANASLAKLKTALIAIGGAVITKQILDVTATFEDLRNSLDIVAGSATAGGKALAQIKDFARTSQFSVEDLSKSFISLKANGVEPTNDLLRLFADTAAVTTDQVGSLEAMTKIFSRAASGAGVAVEDLELIADRGVPVFRILEQQLGITRNEVTEFGKSAEGAQKLLQALQDGLNTQFGGASIGLLENLSVKMSNFRIAIKEFISEFGAGLAPAVKTILDDITGFIDSSKGFGRVLGEAIGDIVLGLRSLVVDLGEALGVFEPGAMQTTFGALLKGLGSFIDSFSVVMDQMMKGITAAVNAIGGLQADVVLEVGVTRQEKLEELKKDLEWFKDPGNLADAFGIGSAFGGSWTTGATAAILAIESVRNEIKKLEDPSTVVFEKIGSLQLNASNETESLSDKLRTMGDEMIAAGEKAVEVARIREAFPAYDDAILRINRTKDAMDDLGKTSNDTADKVAEVVKSPFEQFFTDLITKSRETSIEQINVQLAVAKLKKQLDEGKISLDLYANAMNALGQGSTKAAGDLEKLQNASKDFTDSSKDRIQAAKDDVTLSNLDGIERKLKEIAIEERNLANAAKARITEQFKGVDDAELQKQLAAIDAQSKATRDQREAAARNIEAQKKAQNTFAKGWQDAFKTYKDAAENAADRGAKAFQTFTKSAEDAIVNFVKTGKLSFRDLISDLLEQSLRANIQGLFSGIFNPGSKTGGKTEDIFAGFFANGGLIPSGKFGVVGENGPELVSGPAQVTPMNGGGNVTYNISAVDALSFKQLVARDPGFIHAVANKGGRAVPSRR